MVQQKLQQVDTITDLSTAELAQQIETGHLSAQEVVKAHIQRIEVVNPQPNAVAIPLFEEACVQAVTADESQLVIVLIRKNKLLPVFEILAASPGVKNILFMGNNALGLDEYVKRQPFEFNLFYWLPEFMSMMAAKGLLESKFAEVAFSMHAKAARDEMEDLAREFQELTARTSVDTPNIDTLRNFII